MKTEPMGAEVEHLEKPHEELLLPAAPPDEDADEAPQVNALTTSLAATISSAAAAWMVAGIFHDFTAHIVALLGVLIGGGLVVLSYRIRRASWLQYAVIPVALLAGAILVAPDTQLGSNSFFGLVEEAIKSSGLLQPPIPFDPGWRAILVVLFALLTAGAASLSVSLGRPKIGVGLPVPLTMAAALIQPTQSEIPSVVVALLLVTVALTLAYGAELGGSGQLSIAFESRRMLRGGALALAMGAIVVLLSSLGFLFPQPNQQHVIPPQKPQMPPPEADHILFTYTASRPVPLRLGAIDDYSVSQQAWLMPSYDPSRFKRLQPPTSVPLGGGLKFQPSPTDIVVTIRMDQATGHPIPDVAGLAEIKGTNQAITYDPETGGIGLADRPIYSGLSYTLVGLPIADAAELGNAGPPPTSIAQRYLAAPAAPNEVLALLTSYSQRAAKLGVPEDPFTRVQFLRQSLYNKVVAAGPGLPADVGAGRVIQMLNGGDASPYEIVAAEALLARWAGVPSRIGYGYYGGDKLQDGSFAIHPVHGAMWLEVYFNHFGWEPLVGVPPKAKPSTSQHPKNQVNIAASNQLQLIVYIPVRYPTITLLFEFVQWYLVRVALLILALVLLYAGYPWLFKAVRRRRRLSWGRRHGLEGRIAVAYAELRDRCRDLTIGNPSATPVRFLGYVQDDDEHKELAWLVTRALWGDLRRDLRLEDAESAEKMAASLSRRIWRAQPGLNQVMALIARTSLRDPYSSQVPNFWYELRLRVDPRGWIQELRRTRRRRALLRRRGLAVAATIVVAALAASAGCGAQATAALVRKLPTGLVPTAVGPFTFKYEPVPSKQYVEAGVDALVNNGRVWSIHQEGGITAGAIELALFKPNVDVSDIDNESLIQHCTDNPDDCPGHEILKGAEQSLGSGRFHRLYYKSYERAYEMQLSDQWIFLWFPPKTETMMMMILIGQFSPRASEDLLHALLDYQHHRSTAEVLGASAATQASASAAPTFGPDAATPTTSTAVAGGHP